MTQQKNIDKGKWWDEAWGLVRGCTPVSEGCENCWSAGMVSRFDPKSKLITNGHFNGKVETQSQLLDKPTKFKKPTTFTVWNDLFHKDVPKDFIWRAFIAMRQWPRHRFIILTKRPERMAEIINTFHFKPEDFEHVFFGTTIENYEMSNKRWPYLKQISDARWKTCISMEPLLGPDRLFNPSVWLDWVIVGCESGPKRRPCELKWIRDIVKKCRDYETKVFVKQIPIDGRVSHDMNEWLEDLRVREMPFTQ